MANKRKVREENNGHGTMKSFLPANYLEALQFEDPEPVEISVTIGEKEYVLREADENAAIAYRNAQLQKMRFTSENDKVKVVGTDGTAEVQSLLVSKCLYRVCKDDPDEMEPVPLSEIRGWKPKIVKGLFERIRYISQLDEDTETEESLGKKIEDMQAQLTALKNGESRAKNSPDATETTSA